ncbi:FAD-dependent oxidoreductase [Curvibacter sp. CHRR-16]|uniref:NAD(P)/FAD-dependent oxidoreductase n=1 Tax=Curvibacter sp. CHRR-16 TaxID=2835872 RepID=UPI001BDAF99C|nr:FAD-dependent oxidoreductase [Curvibacter sp. CHRR-16]MBT0569600.1 FAD-dependent oxidoreductase [Curvibacter sp. CHRR-16]
MTTLTSALQKDIHLFSQTQSVGYEPNQLVLLGAGMSNIQLLRSMVEKPLPELRIVLIHPLKTSIYPARLPSFIAGELGLEDCSIELEPLVRQTGVRWLRRMVRRFDAQSQTLGLDNDIDVHYDWLSVNTPALQTPHDAEHIIPGAAEFGLFLQPLEIFATLWPQVLNVAQQRSLRLAVLGSSAFSMEIALAIRQRLPHCAMTYIHTPLGAAPEIPEAVRLHMGQTLRAQRINVLQDSVTSISATELHLGCGARLACDIPLICPAGLPPQWLQNSGLAHDAQQSILTDSYGCSTSHPRVLCTTDYSTDAANNIGALTSGKNLRPIDPAWSGLHILFAGSDQAMACWSGKTMQGRSLTWLKRWADRRTLAHLTAP